MQREIGLNSDLCEPIIRPSITEKLFARRSPIRHIDGMLTLGDMRVADAGPGRIVARWRRLARRCLAMLVACAIVATSFAIAAPASAGSHGQSAAATQMSASHKQAPTPCQKMMLAGLASSCSAAGLGFSGIPAADAGTILPDDFSALHWASADAALPPQCSDLSPYRPPCIGV